MSRIRGSSRQTEVRAAFDALRRIVQALRLSAGAGSVLSSAQLFALQQIAEHPGASINDIAALTFTHQSSVSVVIQRLVARRLVAKGTPRHDRRRQHLVITPAGRRALRNAPAAVQEELIAAITKLSPGDRRVLARALGQVARAVTPKGAAPYPPMLFEDTPGRAPVRSRRAMAS